MFVKEEKAVLWRGDFLLVCGQAMRPLGGFIQR